MAYILGIDTTTNKCSVSFSENGKLIDYLEVDKRNSHAERVNILIDKVIANSKKALKDISAIAVSKGPGSYTGLRIGTSTAKGFCYALNIPLIGINTLKSMTFGVLRDYSLFSKDTLLVPLIDARRDEVFLALYNNKLDVCYETSPFILDKVAFEELRKDKKVIVFGNAIEKCKKIIGHNNIEYIDNIESSAKDLCDLAFKKFEQKQFEDLPYFEPLYAKAFYSNKK